MAALFPSLSPSSKYMKMRLGHLARAKERKRERDYNVAKSSSEKKVNILYRSVSNDTRHRPYQQNSLFGYAFSFRHRRRRQSTEGNSVELCFLLPPFPVVIGFFSFPTCVDWTSILMRAEKKVCLWWWGTRERNVVIRSTFDIRENLFSLVSRLQARRVSSQKTHNNQPKVERRGKNGM